MIKTDKETEEYLKILRKDAYSQPEDPGFSALVWAKVENSPQRILAFQPVYAVAALSAVLFLLFWVYYLPNHNKGDRFGEPVPFVASTPIVGAVLETSGNGGVIEEGDLLTTGPESRMTFFLPGAGYFHLAPESKIEIRKARHVAVPGTVSTASGFQYELFLEEGRLYSKLSKLDSASSLNYLTHFGTVSVAGTDLLLNVEKDSGLSVEILNGEVMVASSKEPGLYKNIKEGFEALISPNTNGILLVTELGGARLAELTDEFTQIFKGSTDKFDGRDTSNFKIVSYREGK